MLSRCYTLPRTLSPFLSPVHTHSLTRSLFHCSSDLEKKRFPRDKRQAYREYFLACQPHFENKYNREVLKKMSPHYRQDAALEEFGPNVFRFFVFQFLPFLKSQ